MHNPFYRYKHDFTFSVFILIHSLDESNRDCLRLTELGWSKTQAVKICSLAKDREILGTKFGYCRGFTLTILFGNPLGVC
mgnify:CR=1 FL=1